MSIRRIWSVHPAIQGSRSVAHGLRSALGEWIINEREKRERLFRTFRQHSERSAAMLDALGWPPPGHLPAHLFDEITNAFSKGDLSPAAVEEIIISSYTSERVLQVYEGWKRNPLLHRCLPILHEAVQAHLEGRYALSIPTIIPQIEGLIAVGFGHSGKISGRVIKAYVETAFARQSNFDKAGAAFFVEILLDQFQWGDPIPAFSRHAILHGADVDYATAANSLRAILILDQLQENLGYIVTKRGKTFHLPACRIVRGRKLRRAYGSYHAALSDDLGPCSVCLPDFYSASEED